LFGQTPLIWAFLWGVDHQSDKACFPVMIGSTWFRRQIRFQARWAVPVIDEHPIIDICCWGFTMLLDKN
jgi:hypothetical protein